MFCSIIIPTVGRHTLAGAVSSVLHQTFDREDYEIIVVNDSGKPLAMESWQSSPRVQVVNTNRRERSVARNAGAAVAKGRYLHFLDDDDWLFPDAYRHLTELSQTSSAKWLYGMTQLVDRQNNPLIQLEQGLQGNCFVQVMAGEWIPLQSSWIERKTFMRIGGFNPLLAGPEDIDLLRRVLLEEEIAETQNLIAHVIMGGDGSTTDYTNHPYSSRWSREFILDGPNAFRRMVLSALDAFWRGRVTRVYLTSVVWNLMHWRFFTASSRMFLSLVSLLTARTSIFATDFWKAIMKPYASLSFEKGIKEARKVKPIDI